LTGFYPRIYDLSLNPTQALGDYLVTYVERDLRQLAAIKDLSIFERVKTGPRLAPLGKAM